MNKQIEKLIEKLNNYLTNWLQAHDFDLVATLGADFEYNHEASTIQYALAVSNAHDVEFFELIHKEYPDIEACDNFVLSFFHELGHYNTYEDWSDRDWFGYNMFLMSRPSHKSYYLYPIEWEATAWGCEYILDHVDEVQDFINGYVPIVKQIIELIED